MDSITKSLFGLSNCNLISCEDLYETSADGNFTPYKKFFLTYSGNCPDACPNCGRKMYSHGKRKIRIMDTPMGGQPVILELEYPRYRCRDCKFMWKPTFEGVDEDRLMTERAFRDIAHKSLRGTFEDVCIDYMLTANTAKNIFVSFFEKYKNVLRFSTPSFLGIFKIKINKIGEVTVITDLEHRTLYDMFIEQNQKSLENYFTQIPDKENVIWICSDMNQLLLDSISTSFSNAKWAIGNYFIIQEANEVIENLVIELSKERMEKSSEISSIHYLKEGFIHIFSGNYLSKEKAQKAFSEWEASVPKEELYDKFRDLAKTVHNFYDQIFAYWDCPITIPEEFERCISKFVQENNCRGYSFDVLRARTMYRTKNLELMLRNDFTVQNFGPSIPECDNSIHLANNKTEN